MQSISQLNDAMQAIYQPAMRAEQKALKHDPLNQLSVKVEAYSNLIRECIGTVSLDRKYRWLALVYRSTTLRQFVCNQPHSLLPTEAQKNKFVSLQEHIFHWYENRAEAGEILSLFQMALTDEFVLTKETPYFGFSRNACSSRDQLLYDLTQLIPDDFVSYYHDLLWNDIASGKKSPFEEVDRHIQSAANAILSTVWGSQTATDLKCWLAEVTGNMSIMRQPEKAILASILCLTFVDPDWKYYYYLPYAGDDYRPYAALGLACSERCTPVGVNSAVNTTWVFKPLEIMETALKHHAEDSRGDWNKVLKEAKSRSSSNSYLAEACKLIRNGLGVEARLELTGVATDGKAAAASPITRWVRVPLGPTMNRAMLGRVFSEIEPQEVPYIVSVLSDAISQIGPPPGTSLDIPFDAESLVLEGWLDIDLVESTRIFGSLTDISRSDSYRLARLLKDYFEKHLFGNRALRTNETPDGWMCGFSKIDHALRAAIALVRDLETELNPLLERDYPQIYRVTRNGIGLRIGVHNESVTLSKKEPLASKQDNALNHTGHLQKQGGERFLKSIIVDRDRPSAGEGKERLSWVIACSAEAFEALTRMRDANDAEAVWLFNGRQPLESLIDAPRRTSQIFGQLKNDVSRFDRIDNVLQVGAILCPGPTRTYPYIKDEARAAFSIIEQAYESHASGPLTCLDIGSGSGIYAMYLCDRFSGAVVTAVEPDEASCQVWEKNRTALGIPKKRCRLIRGRFEDCVQGELDKRWDLVVFNLPYVPNGQPGSYFSHSDGGVDGLEKVRHVLDWLNRDDVHVGRCIFPTYSLARDETIESTLLVREIQSRHNLREYYNIEYEHPLTSNWFVLRYTDEPKQKFVTLEQAFPEARRRSDVANWLYRLKHGRERWSYMCHTIVEMTRIP